MRDKLGWHPRHEFRYSKCSAENRRAFLEAVRVFEFSYWAVVIEKREPIAGLMYPGDLYAWAVARLFAAAGARIKNATVVFDEFGGREYRGRLRASLRTSNTRAHPGATIRKVKAGRSESNNLLQLADMICGLVSRATREHSVEVRSVMRLLREHEQMVVRWPPQK